MRKKLRSQRGDTLVETLAALLQETAAWDVAADR